MANQGFGCMGLSGAYAGMVESSPEVAKAVVHHAFEKGVTLFNSSVHYGTPNEAGYGANLRLLRKAIEGLDRRKIQLMVKIGTDARSGQMVLRTSTEDIATTVDFVLEQLGTDYVDILVLARVPQDRPIEEVVLDMQKAVGAGIKIVAYSPLGRGFLTGSFQTTDSLPENDHRRKSPKFSEGNFQHNIALVHAVQAIADRKGITVGQLALAWLHAQGTDVIPIPGTTKAAHFDLNYAALQVKLSAADLAEIEEVFKVDAVVGERYPGNHKTFHKNA